MAETTALTDPELWDQLLAYEFPNTNGSGLSAQTGASLGWSPDFSQSAFLEYRRAVYLSVTNDSPMVVPQTIHEVWVRHQDAGEAFDGVFCRDVLAGKRPQFLEESSSNNPSALNRTKTLYAAEFGFLPSPKIWSDAPAISRNAFIVSGAILAVGFLLLLFVGSGWISLSAAGLAVIYWIIASAPARASGRGDGSSV